MVDFAVMMNFALSFLGMPDDFTVVIDGVRVDGDLGWIESRWEANGKTVDFGDGEQGGEPGFVWQDGKWVSFVSPEELAEDEPCSLGFDE